MFKLSEKFRTVALKIVASVFIVMGASGMIGELALARVQQQTSESGNTGSAYFTSLNAGVNTGFLSKNKVVFGGIDANLMAFESANIFVQLPGTVSFGNKSYINAKVGPSLAYAFSGNRTLVRGYGLYDFEKLHNDPTFSLFLLGVEGYRTMSFGTLHASTTLYLPLGSDNKFYHNDNANNKYGVDFKQGVFTQNVSYVKVYTYEDVMLGYLPPNLWGIEFYVQPYLINATDDFTTVYGAQKNDTTFGGGIGIKDNLYFLDAFELNMVSEINYRYDSLMKHTINISFGIMKQWWDKKPARYKNDFHDVRQYVAHKLPVMAVLTQELTTKDKASIDGLPDVNFADSGSVFLDDVNKGNAGDYADGSVVLGDDGLDISLDKDFKVTKNFIACSGQYCKFKLKNGKNAFIYNNELTIDETPTFNSNNTDTDSYPKLNLGSKHAIHIAGGGQLQGFHVVNDKTEDYVSVIMDKLGSFSGNVVDKAVLVQNYNAAQKDYTKPLDSTTGGTNVPYDANFEDNKLGGLIFVNLAKNSTSNLTVTNNTITGAGFKTVEFKSLELQFSSDTNYSGDFYARSGLLSFLTNAYVPKTTNAVLESTSKIRVNASKNIVTVTGDVEAPILTLVGDVSMNNSNNMLLDSVYVSGSVHNMCAFCFLTTDKEGIVAVGNIDLSHNIMSDAYTSKTGSIVPDRMITMFYIDGALTHINNSYKSIAPALIQSIKIGNITVKEVAFIFKLNDPTAAAMPNVSIGNIKGESIGTIMLYNEGKPNTAIKIGNIDVTNLGSVLSMTSFNYKLPVNTKITIGNIKVDYLFNALVGIAVVGGVDKNGNPLPSSAEEFQGQVIMGDITINHVTNRSNFINDNFSNACGTVLSLVCILNVDLAKGSLIQMGNVTLPGGDKDYIYSVEHNGKSLKFYLHSIINLAAADIFRLKKTGKTYTVVEIFSPLGGKLDGTIKIGSVISNNSFTRVIDIPINFSGGDGSITIGSGKGLAIQAAGLVGYNDYWFAGIKEDDISLVNFSSDMTVKLLTEFLAKGKFAKPLNINFKGNAMIHGKSLTSAGEIQNAIYGNLTQPDSYVAGGINNLTNFNLAAGSVIKSDIKVSLQ